MVTDGGMLRATGGSEVYGDRRWCIEVCGDGRYCIEVYGKELRGGGVS